MLNCSLFDCADDINLLDVSSVHEFEHWIMTIVECLLYKVQLGVKVQTISLSNLFTNIHLCQISPSRLCVSPVSLLNHCVLFVVVLSAAFLVWPLIAYV